MNAEPLFKRVALIGFGLIGGSIARGARAQGLAGEIVATARSAATRARVQELGIVDRASDSTIGRTLKKTLSNRIGGNAGSFRRRRAARS